MAHSKSTTLPKKPRPDFPLYVHKSDRWAKKVRGKSHYFGKATADPKGDAALAEWWRVREYLNDRRTPPPKNDDRLKVGDVVNHFLTFKKQLVQSGEITSRTWDGYDETCGVIVARFGRDRAAEDLGPTDFQKLRASMSERWGAVRLGNQIQTVRSVFKHAFEMDLLDRPIKFGPAFKKPSAKVLRKLRVEKGRTDYSPEQIQKLLAIASPTMKAMILLGINGGLGPRDLATLPIATATKSNEWLDYARAKTGVARRIPLWPETAAAIKTAADHRPQPKNAADAGLLCIGRRGENYICETGGHRVAQEFKRVSAAAGITGRAFYDLRRTFETVADNLSHDKDTVKAIMGHAFPEADMSARYRQGFYDVRLRRVVNHVRNWLFGKPTNAKQPNKAKDKTDTTPRREKSESSDERTALRVGG